MSDDALEREIGQAAAERLRAKGWTIEPPKPPEPKRLVTMEESRERYVQYCGLTPYPWSRVTSEGHWRGTSGSWQDANRAADDWLVRTVNRRIIEGLASSENGGRRDRYLGGYWVPQRSLLRTFCGEEAP